MPRRWCEPIDLDERSVNMSEDRLLRDRVAIVTGGGAGIGAAIAQRFSDHGAHVEVAEIDPERAEAMSSAAVRTTILDVRQVDAVESWARDVIARRGRVDVVVNNVGHYVAAVPFRESTVEHWEALHEVNLKHVFVVTKAFLPTMIDARRGSIINVHSVEGLRGYPPDPVYGAYKAAVAHFTTCLAGELGRKGIRVNGIAPDLTQTPQVDYESSTPADAQDLWSAWAPVGRIGRPDDQADAALFLASDLSRFVTGVNLPVDGGTHAYGGWFWSPTQRRFTNRPPAL
jgi:NAD(P)-dependent dehydrogenase (short-subunit alcohol dehydrogenase family)